MKHSYVYFFRGIIANLKEKKTEFLDGIKEFTKYFNNHNCTENNEMKGSL